MRILIDINGNGKNYGDVAMLQVMVRRLRALWPDAEIEGIAGRPDLIARYCPMVRPLSDNGHCLWTHQGSVLGRLSRFAPEWEAGMRLRYARQVTPIILARKRRHGIDAQEIEDYLDAVRRADLVTVPGGSLGEAFDFHARLVFETLALAKRAGKVTALMGQGVGPIENPALRAMAAAILPTVDLIALRERRASLPLLRLLGVAEERMITTGDEAVEIAYQERRETLGTGIGVNLRVAPYADVDGRLIATVRPELHAASRRLNAPLIPAPISLSEGESDAETIQCLLAGLVEESDGGASLESPLELIRQIGQCRVVVTGAYHAGVFALSQGIPAVCLARSIYYQDKFLGLADQFGCGCEVVPLDAPEFSARLAEAIDSAWRSAETLRPRLLAAAEKQIVLGKEAYGRLYSIVDRCTRG